MLFEHARRLLGEAETVDQQLRLLAHAEVGQFAEAVRWQQMALEDAAFAKTHGQRARERLELYKMNKPYREP